MFGFKNREIRELRAELREATERATAAERRRSDAHLDEVRRAHAAQCRQLAADVEKWQRKAQDLEAGARRVAAQNRVLSERLEDLRDGSALTALDADYERLDQRHERLRHRVVRYVTELRSLRRQVELHHQVVDVVTGMTDPGTAAARAEAGEMVRAYRHATTVAPAPKLRAASPSGRLPRRGEPGLEVDAS